MDAKNFFAARRVLEHGKPILAAGNGQLYWKKSA
jgi:hypothetical protein